MLKVRPNSLKAQTRKVLGELLINDRGVTADDLRYGKHLIMNPGARIFELREAGVKIASVPTEGTQAVRYVLKA